MGTTIEKILNLLQMKKNAKSYSVQMYAEMKLEDGRIIATEDEQFMIGSRVFSVSDDGSANALTSGEYTMENGNKMSVDSDSKITDLGEEEESVAEEDAENNEEELAEDDGKEADVDDWAGMEKRIQNLEDAVADLKADKESMSEESVEEEKTEMSADSISELMTQIEELNSKVVELSGEPATETIHYNPEGNNVSFTEDLTKLSSQERAAYYINNLK